MLLNEVVEPDRRGAVNSSYFVAAYLGMALPVLGIGLGTIGTGLATATTGFAIVIGLISVLAAILLAIRESTGRPAPKPGT